MVAEVEYTVPAFTQDPRERYINAPKLLRSFSEAFPKLQESQGQSLVTGRVQFVLLESWRLTKLRTDRKLETFRRLANAEA